ncbi:MAG: UDP binding domain-containing protein [Candidatus Bathyarchaeia archaeon]
MPTALRIKPEEVDTPEKRVTLTVSVIGCGQRGILFALAFAEAGFKVICADADQSVVKRLSRGTLQVFGREAEAKLRALVRTGRLSATNDLKTAVSQSNVIVIATSARFDAKKKPDCSEIENICKQTGSALRPESLVVFGGLAAFGFTEGVVKETLENTSGLKMGNGFGLAYASTLQPLAVGLKPLDEHGLIVAAADNTSLNSASTFLATLAKERVKQTSNVKLAELGVLFAAAQRDASMALSNELAVFCENVGVDYADALALLNSDACGLGLPSIEEEANGVEAYLLLESAENFEAKLRLLAKARQVNEDMVKHAVSMTQEALRGCGKPLRRARISLLGAFRSETAAAALSEALEAKGAKVAVFDPDGSVHEVEEAGRSVRKTLNEAVEGTDCVVFLSYHDVFRRLSLNKMRALMRSPAAFVDLVGVLEPLAVVEEGFVYRGLGRGGWKK